MGGGGARCQLELERRSAAGAARTQQFQQQQVPFQSPVGWRMAGGDLGLHTSHIMMSSESSANSYAAGLVDWLTETKSQAGLYAGPPYFRKCEFIV
eukprot:COSAG01_NODE_963_length_12407_cov_38.330598_19_plen_96_part_00